tara:strand:- start:260 stop:370 length:111 start_codon:yes stop_codon:yes gene_type:complete
MIISLWSQRSVSQRTEGQNFEEAVSLVKKGIDLKPG